MRAGPDKGNGTLAATERQTRLVETARGTVEYREIGQGVPVLFIHGGQGNALNSTFDKAFDLSTHRLIIPSRPGYQRTSIAGNETPLASAEMIAELLDRIEAGPVIVLGVSLGGRPAIAFAARFPERTRALVLNAAVTGEWLKPGDARYRQSRLLFDPRYERFVWMATRGIFSLFPRRAARVFVNSISTRPVTSVALKDAEILHDKIAAMRSYSGLAADLDHRLEPGTLARVRCPTLLQHSLNDGVVDISHAERALAAIPRAELKLYDNAFGHFLWAGPGSEKVLSDLTAFVAAREKEPLVVG